MAETGLEGYARYWLLLEHMARKFNGSDDELFVFSIKDLKDILGFYHVSQMRMYLQCVENLCVMSFEWSDNVVRIQSRILLELQSRDFKKARTGRAETAPKNKDIRVKKKNKDKEKFVFDFSLFKSSFKKATGIGISGGAEKRFKEQIKSEKDFQDLLLSVKHYGEFLNHPDNSWRKPKQSMSAYLGTDSTDFFWRDFIEKPEIVAKSDDRWAPLYENQGEKHETL